MTPEDIFNQPAFPHHGDGQCADAYSPGLTKLELFTLVAMGGFCAGENTGKLTDIAVDALGMAKAQLSALAAEQSKGPQ